MKSRLPLVAGLLLGMLCTTLNAQKIGLLTDSPDAPVHILSSGQVNTPGGLLLLGNRSEGHLEIDFDLLQSKFGGAGAPLTLRINPFGGNVGVNTPLPDAPFHIASSGQVNVPGGLVLLGNRVEGSMELDFNRMQSRFGAASYLTLLLQPDGGDLNAGDGILFVDRTNSRVGVNSLFPSTDFHVRGEMGMTTEGLGTSQKDKIAIQGTLETPSSVGLGWLKTVVIGGATGGAPTSGSRAADIYEMYYKSQGAHRWFINENASTVRPQMILDSDGELGIGPSEANSRLHVTEGFEAAFNTKGYLALGEITSTNLVFDDNEILARNNAGPSPLWLQYDGGDVMLVAGEAGQVGIGVLDTANMPSDDYLLAVDGKIMSEEVRVELSANWPDYVFDQDYNLKSLDQLSKEINTLGHLPGMPSAKEVGATGFELGEMQRKVVEKVEELTLYILQLDAANKALQAELQLLKEGNK